MVYSSPIDGTSLTTQLSPLAQVQNFPLFKFLVLLPHTPICAPHKHNLYTRKRSSSRKILHSLRVRHQTQANAKNRSKRTNDPKPRSHVPHEGENDNGGYGNERGD